VWERTAEVEQRTPSPVTWQHLSWPAHCGDYACFIGEVGQPDLNALAPNGDGKAFLAEHLHEAMLMLETDIWDWIRPDSPKDASTSYSVGVYLFQCLHCGHYLILWDVD